MLRKTTFYHQANMGSDRANHLFLPGLTCNRNLDSKEMADILLWDLSAAFDTMDANLICKKLEIYSPSEIS